MSIVFFRGGPYTKQPGQSPFWPAMRLTYVPARLTA